tara:strand:- start:705 stop:1238 length:534 start_codon:yes stop_codon:yes gene_type:complete
MSKKATVLEIADFNPRIKSYLYWYVNFLLLVCIITIPIIPLSLIIAPYFIGKYFDRLQCQLTTRSLSFNKGFIFRIEKTIPLDKIQDLTFKEGPLLKAFGLSILKIETAGSSAQGTADLTLIGIVNASEFRNRVLDQRDKVTENLQQNDTGLNSESMLTVLQEIRDSLKKVESKLSE